MPVKSGPVRVLVVDDSALMRRTISDMLTAAGMQVSTARDGVDALAKLHELEPDVVTLDINMPEMDGLTCLARIMIERPTPVVMVSSLVEPDAAITLEALTLGAVDYVPKPGGTVSLNLDQVRHELVTRVTGAAAARVRRAGTLRERLRHHRDQAGDAAVPEPRGRRAPSRTTTRRERIPTAFSRFDLVLIGSSTGGPSALEEVLVRLPADFPAPVVVAQHIPAAFTGHLAQRLDGECEVGVEEVTGSTVLQPGRVYIGRGDADVVIGSRAGEITARSVPSSADYRWHPSVDRMVASALDNVPAARMVGVLLTGMGDDGATELARLHELGGLTIAESEESCVVFGMPAELIGRGGADCVLPIGEIGAQVSAWVARRTDSNLNSPSRGSGADRGGPKSMPAARRS